MRSVGGVLVSFPEASSPWMDTPLKSVTHGQCDARPTVTFPAAGYRRSFVGTKLYCSGDGDTWYYVRANMPRVDA